MNLKTLVVTLIVAATLSAPTRSEAAGTAEASQLLLPAVGLVAGLIGGKIVGASMGIAAFGTAIVVRSSMPAFRIALSAWVSRQALVRGAG